MSNPVSRVGSLEHDGALTAVNSAAVRARESLTRVHALAPDDDVALRLQAAAMALHELSTAVPESLRFQAAAPLRVPAVAAHVPEFLRTRKEPEMEAADAAAFGSASEHDIVAYNAACRELTGAVAAEISAALATMAASSVAALASLPHSK